jgi:hypothetical protein
VDEDLLCGLGLRVVVEPFDELAGLEGGAGAEERDQVRGIHRLPPVEAQRTRSREAEQQWSQGSDYLYALRRHTGGIVIGTFGLHRRIGPGALNDLM